MALVHALLRTTPRMTPRMTPQPRQPQPWQAGRKTPRRRATKRSFDEIADEVQQEALPTTLLASSGDPQTLWPNKGQLLSEWAELELYSSDGARPHLLPRRGPGLSFRGIFLTSPARHAL
jgi:hypothetical protein